MAGKTADIISHDHWHTHMITAGKLIPFILLLLLLFPRSGHARQLSDYDEIPVFITVQGVGSVEMPALIRNEEVYLPITYLFDFLKIKNTISAGLDSVSGSFINAESVFLVDKIQNHILYEKKVFPLKPDDLIRTETNLYLKASYFGQAFALNCKFNFRSLSVAISTDLELPVIREMRREMMYQNISHLTGKEKADTTISRSYPLFHFGTADWSVVSAQQPHTANDTRLSLLLGGIIAGGETTIALNYANNEPFTEKQQYYLWRLANNDHTALRQILVGKIPEQPASSIYNPIVGAQFTNTPTTYRRSFGTYTITDHTQPGYTVELYVNNVLVNYVKADPAGFYSFQVPLVYGNSVIKLRFYGPWGEQSSREENINIPFNFLPAREFEYKVSAGVVEDIFHSKFSRARFNYGLSRNITVGAGMEYLSSVNNGKGMPFVNTSVRLASSVLLASEHTYGVQSKTILSYRRPSNFYVELNYTKYEKGQTAINVNYREERKLIVAIPMRTRYFALFSRFTYDQIRLPSISYSTIEWLLTGTILGTGISVNTYKLNATEDMYPYTYSNAALTFRLPGKILFTPQAQYQYAGKEFISAKAVVEKSIATHGYLNMSYERNFKSQLTNISVGVRFDLSFAQVGVTTTRMNQVNTLIESARGSLMYDSKSRYVGTTNRTSVGRGGIIVSAFLDLNNNGRRDMNEPKVSDLKLRVNGGLIERNDQDTSLRISNLEPYTNYLITLDRSSFDNIAWQLTNTTINVTADANSFKLVEVPVAVVGEVSGTVYLKEESGKKGLGQIIVCIYNSDHRLAARTMTEPDGYFSFLGLSPGSYTAQIDNGQLKKLNMTSSEISLPFKIMPSKEGDVVDGLQFTLQTHK